MGSGLWWRRLLLLLRLLEAQRWGADSWGASACLHREDRCGFPAAGVAGCTSPSEVLSKVATALGQGDPPGGGGAAGPRRRPADLGRLPAARHGHLEERRLAHLDGGGAERMWAALVGSRVGARHGPRLSGPARFWLVRMGLAMSCPPAWGRGCQDLPAHAAGRAESGWGAGPTCRAAGTGSGLEACAGRG